MNMLQENVRNLQDYFGIVLSNQEFVGNEIQMASGSPVGGFVGVYDPSLGIYLGREVWWCRRLTYSDPDGKAISARVSLK